MQYVNKSKEKYHGMTNIPTDSVGILVACFSTGNKRWYIFTFVVVIWMLLISQNDDHRSWNYEEPEAWPVTFLSTSCFCIIPLLLGPGAECGQGARKVITDWQPHNHFFIKVHMGYVLPARLCSLLTWLFPLYVLKCLTLQILVSYPTSSLLGLCYSPTAPHLSALAAVPAKSLKTIHFEPATLHLHADKDWSVDLKLTDHVTFGGLVWLEIVLKPALSAAHLLALG